jgi:hypothetical protein
MNDVVDTSCRRVGNRELVRAGSLRPAAELFLAASEMEPDLGRQLDRSDLAHFREGASPIASRFQGECRGIFFSCLVELCFARLSARGGDAEQDRDRGGRSSGSASSRGLWDTSRHMEEIASSPPDSARVNFL